MGGGEGLRKGVLDSLTDLFQGCSTYKLNCFNPILHGLFQFGSTQGGGEGRHKVLATFFSETVKITAIKLGTLTN